MARYLTKRTHLEEEGEIVWKTWRQRLLFRISRKYPLLKLSSITQNILWFWPRNILIIENWHCIDGYYWFWNSWQLFNQYWTRNLNPPWSSLIIFMASIINKRQCSGFFIDLSKSPLTIITKRSILDVAAALDPPAKYVEKSVLWPE